MKVLTNDDGSKVVYLAAGENQDEKLLALLMNGFQNRVALWQDERVPGARSSEDAQLVLTEEVGELSRAVVKGKQKIRFTPPEIKRMKREEAADVLLALLDFCALECFSLAEAAVEVFAKKGTPAYDLVRAADKRRRDAADSLVNAQYSSLIAMRNAGLPWGHAAVRSALVVLGSASGRPREEIVAEVDEMAATKQSLAPPTEKEPAP